MILIVNGQKKDLHYTIAAKLLKSGKATFEGKEVEEVEEIKPKYEKKIIKNTGKKK